jgi:hypothetical protein
MIKRRSNWVPERITECCDDYVAAQSAQIAIDLLNGTKSAEECLEHGSHAHEEGFAVSNAVTVEARLIP